MVHFMTVMDLMAIINSFLETYRSISGIHAHNANAFNVSRVCIINNALSIFNVNFTQPEFLSPEERGMRTTVYQIMLVRRHIEGD
jgi:hypothetical protein